MKVIHVFNSHIASGPEKLVIPSLIGWHHEVEVVNLLDTRAQNRPGALRGQDAAAFARAHGLKAANLEVRKRWDKKAIRELAANLEVLRPDIVHSHDVKASLYLLKARELAQTKRYSIVSTHHGVRGRFGWKIRFYEMFYSNLVLPKFDRVLAVCSSDREILLGRGLRPDRVFTHHNGVDRPPVLWSDRIEAQRRIRAKWQAEGRIKSSEGFFIGIVARLCEGKEHLKALKVLQNLKQSQNSSAGSGEKVRLLCFGVGPLQDELKQAAEEMGVSHEVSWCGYSPDISNEMAGLDLMLSLSRAEGLPVSLLEAGHSSTPVFAAAVDGVLDVVRDGIEGELCTVEDDASEIALRLQMLIDDSARRQRYARALHTRVASHFSRQNWLNSLDEIYQKLRGTGE